MSELNYMLNEDMQDAYQIFCDMDSVLTDFDERFEHFSGLSPDEYMKIAERQFGPKIAKQKFWELIDEKVGLRFWRGMQWFPGGQELWDYIKQYNPIILTAPSRNNVSVEGKTHWVADNLGEYRIEFRQAYEKPELAGSNQILIDDKESTILSWKQNGGIGLLYTGDTEDTIRELRKIGL